MTWNQQNPDFLNDHSLLRMIVKKLAILPANAWSLIRLLGIIAIIYIDNSWAIFFLFIFFLLTDGIDGLVARSGFWAVKILDPFYILYKMNLIKERKYLKAGEWFDPLADKIFIISTFFYLGVVKESLIPVFLFCLMIGVEILGRITIIFFRKIIFKKEIIFRANYFGKYKFLIESIIGLIIILNYIISFNFNDIIIWAITFEIILSTASALGHIFVEKYEQWGFFPSQKKD